MTYQEVIMQLEDLIQDRQSLMNDDIDLDDILIKDIVALKEAIGIIKEAKEVS